MDDVSAADLNDRQKLQVDVTLARRPGPEVIAPQLFAEMDAWEFPLHFVDFETIMPAIPFHAGMRPYQNLAFQFSCHHLGTDGEVTHDGWLATDAGEFPNWAFLMALRTALGEHGTIFRFAEHENTILRHLRDQLRTECRPVPPELDVDDYCDWVDSITAGGSRAMVDMCALVSSHVGTTTSITRQIERSSFRIVVAARRQACRSRFRLPRLRGPPPNVAARVAPPPCATNRQRLESEDPPR